MPSPEDRISAGLSEDTPWITDEPAEVSQNTDALVIPEQQTEELLQFFSEADQVTDTSGSHATQTQASMRPFLSPESPFTQETWSLTAQLREENVHLHQKLTEQDQQLQQLIDDYTSLRREHERTIVTIHDGHQQDLEHYQIHLKEAIEERNRLQETCIRLEQNYQELYHTFQDIVEEELQKRLTEAAYTLQTSPDTAPPILQDAMRIFGRRARQLEEKSLVETLYLKQELHLLATQLQEERQQLEQERQNLLAMHHTAREQVELHQKTAKARLHARWRAASLSIAIGLLALFVVMQFVFLYIFHAALTPSVSFALLAPILLCIALAFTFSRPASMVKHVYFSAPHKKKVGR
jgi:Fe2+ transport system protein B